jgi:hypothetical protein
MSVPGKRYNVDMRSIVPEWTGEGRTLKNGLSIQNPKG